MARLDEKGKRFEFLVERIDEANRTGFYVEAMALTYALMEERTYTLLKRLGIPYKSGDKLYQCLVYLKKCIQKRTLSIAPKKISLDELHDWLKAELIDTKLVDNIQSWRNRRNDITHDLAKQTIAYNSIGPDAIQGSQYFRKYTAIIMRLKKLV